MNRESTTDREFEAIELIALFGLSKKEIADKWSRSLFTVETTIKNAYRKLGFKNAADATRWYCGIMFDIAEDIKERQKEILSIAIIIFSTYAIYPSNGDMQTRNNRNQRTCAVENVSNRLRSRRRERPIPLKYFSNQNTIAA